MSISVVPNSGALFDDRLDGLRQSALIAIDDTPDLRLPIDVVTYINALEREVIDRKCRERKGWVEELWRPRTQPREEGQD